MGEVSQILLLQDLAVVMIVAAVVTLVFHRWRQPVVLGYILAGLIIGPHLLPQPLISDEESIRTLAALGVIFLMFSLGLDFSLRTLKQVGATAFIGATLEIVALIWIGFQVGLLFGWSKMDSLFLGAILSISSTTITIKVLTEMGQIKARFAQLSLGILIVEDIMAIALIALLWGGATTGSLAIGEVALTIGRIVIFLVVVLIFGLILVPRLLRGVAKYRCDEMLLVTVLGLCFGVSLLTVKLGYGVALGAFVIGTVIGEAREIGKIRLLTEPVRDMFSAVFFVAIGMLFEPAMLVKYAGPILVVTITVVLAKIVTRAFGVFLAGNDPRTSVRVAVTLAQIGEFSFIIAGLGMTLRVTSEFLYPIAVSVSAITTLLTPYLIRRADGIVNAFDRVAPGWLVGYLDMYGRWIQRLRQRGTGPSERARKLMRKWVAQILLNLAIVTGLFMGAAFFAGPLENRWPSVPEWIGGASAILWLGPAVVALPSLIAAFRKLEALALLVADLAAQGMGTGTYASTVRSVVANTILIGGTSVLGLWLLAISVPFLPTWPGLLVLLLIVAAVTWLLRRFFTRVHAKAQFALLETFSQSPPVWSFHEQQPLPTILREAQLETVTIAEGSAAAGKLIRELELRTQTGASAVGIERHEHNIINPGPDEELLEGDRVLLLGDQSQLAAARDLLTGKAKGTDASLM